MAKAPLTGILSKTPTRYTLFFFLLIFPIFCFAFYPLFSLFLTLSIIAKHKFYFNKSFAIYLVNVQGESKQVLISKISLQVSKIFLFTKNVEQAHELHFKQRFAHQNWYLKTRCAHPFSNGPYSALLNAPAGARRLFDKSSPLISPGRHSLAFSPLTASSLDDPPSPLIAPGRHSLALKITPHRVNVHYRHS